MFGRWIAFLFVCGLVVTRIWPARQVEEKGVRDCM